jgi:hypothetical protein
MVTIDSKFGSDEALKRLKNLLTGLKESRSATGETSGSSIALMRSQRVGNSIFRPQFYGEVSSGETECSLNGEFRLSRTAKTFARGWFGFVGVWTMLTSALAIQSTEPYSWVLPLAGVVLLGIGVLFLWFAQRYYESDKDWILRILSDELRTK